MIHLLTTTLMVLAPFAAPAASLQQKPAEAQPAQEGDDAKPLKIGSTVAETVELRDMDGKKLSFKELRGKVVLIHFWSDRCPAEKHADPVMKSLEGYFAEKKDVVIVGIASNQNEIGEAPKDGEDLSKRYTNYRKKLEEIGFKHRIFIDHGNQISALFQAKSTPHCFVVDAKGVLRYSGALDDDLAGEKGDKAKVYVRDAVDALLAGKAVEVAETKPYG